MKGKISLSEQAYKKIQALLVSLRLRPGAQVNEGDLERELSIGRTPIREALLRLTAEGFLVSVPGRGFFVRSIALKDVKALFEAMMILERGASALAARRMKSTHIDRLLRFNRELEIAMEARDFLEVTLINSRFHQTIYDAADNVFLRSSLNNFRALQQRLAYLCFSQAMRPEEMEAYFSKVVKEHESIATCLREGDEIGVVDMVTQHIRLFYTRVQDYLSPPPETILLFHEPLETTDHVR